MGLTKQYLRYVPAGNLNIIASPRCNTVFVTLEGQEGRFVAAGACEHVIIWDLRLGEKAQVLLGETSIATRLAASPNKRHLAVGYADGAVKTFDLRSGETISIFIGHRSEVTSLAYDNLGHRVASGSKDTDIIVWDIVAETGVCRLSGHKGSVTQVMFLAEHDIIISSSKDTFVKFWDLDTQHNFKTLVGHRSEVWGLTLAKEDKYLITGSNENELFVWKIYFADVSKNADAPLSLLTLNTSEEGDIDDARYPLRCEKIGSILRVGRGRIVSLGSDATSRVMACHGTDNTVEIFHFLPDDLVQTRLLKRQKKEKRKAAKEGKPVEEIETDSTLSLKNEIKRLPVIKASNKAKGLDLVLGKGGELRICICANNNSIELHSATIGDTDIESRLLRSLTTYGHRTDVRALCFSSDNLALATASGDSVKLWNRPSLACLRTVECGYALTACFAPGDRHLIVGLKDGKMLIIDIAAGDILEEIPAHSKELWSVVLYPDMRGVASGGGDGTVKFWNFELIEDPESETKAKLFSVLHTRTLKLEESVLAIRISPDSRLIAVALLDSTVKIFFLDTFKFFVSLYGHKLPVICMDISSDSTLIATGSADRNVKIWGLDFGDCHKSLFAHDDSVTGLAFVPKTHYFFTCGKDGKVKQWDADIFQKIITLQGHSGEAWNCAVSPNGIYVSSCGSDKVVRLYERSAEPLVLEDEAEEEREKLDNDLATGETSAVQGQKAQSLPSRKTVNSEKAAELILECLEVSKQYEEQLAEVVPANPLPPVPPLMQAYSCSTTEDFLLETVKRVRASELEEALLLLPYSAVCEILKILPKLLKGDYQTELVSRLTISLVHAHHGPIVTSKELLTTLEMIKNLSLERITTLRDTVGYNLYGMAYTQRAIEEREGVQLFKDATKSRKQKNKVRRNKERALKRAIMTL
ncbi:WD repeat-containing protein 3 [Neodiprion pinetum]|uniref:WD repeat-containing protein 3 n=1 Tax=Neodiprion pinetum TaxID=441929 RepID=UPI001EDEBD55|nr:WD repeat-containing protein 3 [Neodiprion pinetum]